jgi:hypothetical protein
MFLDAKVNFRAHAKRRLGADQADFEDVAASTSSLTAVYS